MVPDTDFPDVRNKSLIHSNHGSCLVVPRESDRVRIYMQLADKDVINAETGRVDKDKMGPEKLLEVSGIHQAESAFSYIPRRLPESRFILTSLTRQMGSRGGPCILVCFYFTC